MIDVNLNRLHELTIILYALSVLLYFIDFSHNNRKANKMAFSILAIVWSMQTVFLFVYMWEIGHFPILTIFEGLYFYAWILITFSLIINWFLRMDFVVFFTNVIGFMVMVIHTFSPTQSQNEMMLNNLVSELSLIHITLAILSYATFGLSFVFSLLYLIQYDLLKRKKWGKRLLRLGDLSKLEKLSNLLVAIGVPLLLISLILGLQYGRIKVPDLIWYDMKILGSFFVLFIYGVYLYLKVKKQMYGKSLALLNIAAFLIVLINFFLFGSLSTFHIW